MFTINYEGYELVVSKYNHALFSGECKELKYYRSGVCLNWLHSDFVKAVDNKKKTTEHTMTYKGYELHVTARQFALIKSSYDLDKECVPDSSNTYCGECKEIGFKLYLCVSIGTLINRFKDFVDELKSEPEQKEYQGYIYFIEKPDPHNAWYVGTSTLQGESWRRESSTKEEIEREFKQEVDERLKRDKILEYQQEVWSKQDNLEYYLIGLGYSFYTLYPNDPQKRGRFAIHSDYLELWDKTHSSTANFPNWAVVRIW